MSPIARAPTPVSRCARSATTGGCGTPPPTPTRRAAAADPHLTASVRVCGRHAGPRSDFTHDHRSPAASPGTRPVGLDDGSEFVGEGAVLLHRVHTEVELGAEPG